MKKWSKRQKRLHKELYLTYRKKELLWYLDVFLSVNHPKWAVKKFLTEFENDKMPIRNLFARVLICGGSLAYSMAIPYQDDLERVIGFMFYRQYIEVKESMLFSQIMQLPRVFKLSPKERFKLRDKLLQCA